MCPSSHLLVVIGMREGGERVCGEWVGVKRGGGGIIGGGAGGPPGWAGERWGERRGAETTSQQLWSSAKEEIRQLLNYASCLGTSLAHPATLL